MQPALCLADDLCYVALSLAQPHNYIPPHAQNQLPLTIEVVLVPLRLIDCFQLLSNDVLLLARDQPNPLIMQVGWHVKLARKFFFILLIFLYYLSIL